MAALSFVLTGLTSQSYVIGMPASGRATASFPTVLRSSDAVMMPHREREPTLPFGVENNPKHFHDTPGVAYGQPTIAGLSVQQVRDHAKKAAKKDAFFTPTPKDGLQGGKFGVVTGGWGTLE